MSKITQIISYPSLLPKLKTCIQEESSLYIIKEIKTNARPTLSGYEGELLHLIADGLGVSLEYYVAQASRLTYASKNISEIGGCFGMVARGEVDFSIAGHGQTYEMVQIANTSQPYLYLTSNFVTKQPGYVQKPFVFVEPFTMATWLVILLVLLLISLTYYLIQRRVFNFGAQLFSKFSELITHSSNYNIRIDSSTATTPEKILTGFWYVCAYFLALFYIAVIFNFMIVPRRESPLDSNEKLLYAVQRGVYKVSTPLHGKGNLLGLHITNPTLRELGQIIAKNGWGIKVTKANFEHLLRNNWAIAMSNVGLQSIRNPSFPLIVFKDNIYSFYVAPFFSKSFLFKEEIDFVVLRILETGLYTKILDHYIFQQHLKDDTYKFEDQAIKPLSFEDIEGILILYTFGILLSLAGLFLEILRVKICYK